MRESVSLIDNVSSNLCDQLKSKLDNFIYLNLTIDESHDIINASQFLIFIRGINNRFEITEELLSAYFMKDTTTDEDFLSLFKKFYKNIVFSGIKL